MTQLSTARASLAFAALLAFTPLLAAEITVTAADGVTVYGDAFAHVGNRSRGTILLFHQASANAQEYATIAPQLAGMGFDVVAADQRAGGGLFSGVNRTVKGVRGDATNYAAALPDLEAMLADARHKHPDAKVLVWGSSYSSALVFVLAARHPDDVVAVLAFSPDEYLPDFHVAQSAGTLHVPVYITSASDPAEIAAAKRIADAVPGGMAVQFAPKIGVHGSSTLREDADPKGYEANWLPVVAFLDRVAP